MEITTFSKCSCGYCGHIIEYLSSEAGKTVQCPECEEKSELPAAPTLMLVEAQGPPMPATKACPVCGSEMKFLGTDCANCKSKRKRKLRLVAASVSVVMLLIGIWMYLGHSRRIEAKKEADFIQQEKTLLAQPEVSTPKSINDLRPGRFSLEQKRGSDLVMAVGDMENASGNVHHGLKVELDLLDATGAKIDTISDVAAELGPHQSWHVVTQVTNPKVTSVRFASIKEDQ